MKVTAEKNEKVANMIFASIYPLYWNRLEKHGRTKEEFHQVIEWLTGFDVDKLQTLIAEKVTFRTFFEKAKIIKHQASSIATTPRRVSVKEPLALYSLTTIIVDAGAVAEDIAPKSKAI